MASRLTIPILQISDKYSSRLTMSSTVEKQSSNKSVTIDLEQSIAEKGDITLTND